MESENKNTINELKSIEEEAEKGLKKTLKKIRKARKRTKIVIGIILVIVLIFVGFAVFGKKSLPYDWVEVERGEIIEEVSATGEVELAEEVDLMFKTSGVIDKINVKVGDEVKKGTYLVQLSSGQLYSQFLQAQANYNQAKAKLDQLLAGATTEEINIQEQVVENNRISWEDTKLKAENDLSQDYNSALVYLVNASSNYNKALADLRDMERLYFYRSDTLSTEFRSKRALADSEFNGIPSLGIQGAKELVDEAVDDSTDEKIDLALDKMQTAIQKIIDALDYTKLAMSDPTIREDVASADKTIIEADITNVNSSFSNVNSATAAISNQKIVNQTSINTAESAYKKSQLDLEKLKAAPRDVDIAIYQADVEKYKANMNEFSQKLQDAAIIAPFDGVVAKLNAKIGEVVNANDRVVVSLISPGAFQIRTDISEADIRKVGLGNPVEIILDAFPEEEWEGRVVEIEPGETIIDNVVYYRIKILFGEEGDKIRSGMTTDTTIQTNKKENVLFVPQRAIVYSDDSKFVRVLKGETFEEVEVETGLKGRDGEIEIVSGLSEGDKVITFIKND